MSQRRHHPVNKNGGKGEEREEVEGKQKKKEIEESWTGGRVEKTQKD